MSAYAQVEMKDAPELLHFHLSERKKIIRRFGSDDRKSERARIRDRIDDPGIPLDRNLYFHPLAGVLRERNFDNFLLEEG